MTIAMCEAMATPTMMAVEPEELNEPARGEWVSGQLVRGEDTGLVRRIEPLLRERSVMLDLAGVERIDAAGITALLALYRSAREFGHRFNLTNVAPRVAQILAVVGLDRFLLSHNAVRSSNCGPRLRRPAA
jgi:anti-anti-sigma factor